MGSYVPPLRRKDSFGLEFNNYPDMESVRKVLFESMKLTVDSIIGIQNLNRNRIVVKIISSDMFEEVMNKFEDQTIVFGAVSVKVINLSKSFSYVSVRNAPFELDDDTIVKIMSRYGKVDSIRNNRFSFGPFSGLLTGVRTVKMRIRENIPSSFTIRGHAVSIMYNGQVRTCYKCGLSGHLLKDCATESYDRVNIFSDEDFPEISSSRKDKDDGKQNEEEELATTKDETIELTQDKNDGQILLQVDDEDTEHLESKNNDVSQVQEGTKVGREITEDIKMASIEQDGFEVRVDKVDVHHSKDSDIEINVTEENDAKRKRNDKRYKDTSDVITVEEADAETIVTTKEVWRASQEEPSGLKITLKKDGDRKGCNLGQDIVSIQALKMKC